MWFINSLKHGVAIAYGGSDRKLPLRKKLTASFAMVCVRVPAS